MSDEVGWPIVAGVDGSDSARHAALWAADEAARRRVPLRLVFAVHMPAYTYADNNGLAVDYTEDLVDAAQSRLAGLRKRILAAHPVRRVVRRDQSARCLIEQAGGARMLVVGSRGRGGFTGMLLGSTSQTLVHHAPCPLLVARPNA